MKFRITLSWLALSGAMLAAPKFVVIRVTEIYREPPSTAAKQMEFQTSRDAINNGQRAEGFRKVLGELQSVKAIPKENTGKIDTEEGKKLIRDYEIKRQKAETLRQDFEECRVVKTKRINKDMVTAMRATLQRITDEAAQLAKEQNIDGVLDICGNSNTELPLILYSGDAPDISDDVIALLDEKSLEEASELIEIVPELEEPKEN